MADKELKEIPEQEEKGIAMELLRELKNQNQRLMRVVAGLIILVGLVVGGFLIYLYQYDFAGSIEQNGVYTLVDSSGNVITSDITTEQLKEILEVINNGKSKDNQNKD